MVPFVGALSKFGIAKLVLKIIIVITFYIFTSMSLYEIALGNNYDDKAVLAWIPLAQLWLMSLIIGDIKWGEEEVKSIVNIIIYLTIFIFNSMINNFIINLILLTAGALIIVIVYYEIYRRLLDSEKAYKYAIISSIIPIVLPIILYNNKDKKIKEVKNKDYKKVIEEYIEEKSK